MPLQLPIRSALVVFIALSAVPAHADIVQKAKDFFEKLKTYAEVAKKIAGVVKEYPKKLAELRARRAGAPPFDLGFDPAKYKSAAGQLELARKADLLLASTRRHLHDKVLITATDLNPDTFEILRFFSGLGDAGCHHGNFVAALAYRYGVTGAKADLDELLDSLQGAYNQITITSAPNGFLFDPRTGQKLAARPGLPVRGYANIADPLVKDMDDISKKNPSVFGYEGSLMGLPKAVYHFNSDISRDETDGIFFGLSAAWEVLTKRNVEPEWRDRIGKALAQTVKYLIQNGYKFIDFTGKATQWGDETSFVKDPTMPFNVTSWLATAARLSGDPAVKKELERFSDKYFGKQRLLKASAFAAALGLVAEVAKPFPELIGYMVNSYNHMLMIMYVHNLVRDAPDARLRALAVDFLEGFVWPLAAQARVPFFDYVYMNATRKRDPALLDRAIGFLGQVRGAPFPQGNPFSKTELVTDFSNRADLRDPLLFFLKEQWEKIRKLLPGNPEGPLAYGGSIWPLGPGLVPKSNFIERATAYELKGEDPYAWSWTGNKKNARGYPAHDYLLSYWFGRYYGLLGPGAAVNVAALRDQAKGGSAKWAGELWREVVSALQKVAAWAMAFVHRLESQEKCVSKHVVPLAQRLAGEVRTAALAKVRAFFGDLGPSLSSLSAADRHTVVDDAWNGLLEGVRKALAEARAHGEKTIAPWFGKAPHREAATQKLRATFDDAAAKLTAEAQGSYDAAMK
jgi:hypothetical protein